ncbi:Protein kinase-like domain [Pseudocohnilembus persalinus]|uniref:Protein kinase-like domain n=1 Tax=Pseudocohnilembus persalinus TaxID=266149 RepID=A0A0V0R978_PSEPJ|nr:Protein kinase-like domain [Pseudocohnilembus persalinus]|eukprot:KRX10760.1 Protein kinase-like domain [Pseudocohnilembus persalinus]
MNPHLTEEENYEIAKTDLSDCVSELYQLGVGGQGQVFKGIYNDEFVAIKQIPVQGKEDSDYYLKREKEINSILNMQPQENVQNIVICKCLIEKQNHIYMIMEYFDWNLDEFLRDVDDIYFYQKEIIYEILQGVKQLHDLNIVHRDLKPSNILVKCGDDDEIILKISDFGLSKQISDRNSKHSNSVGTSVYRDPSIQKGVEYSNQQMKQQDIYSLGLIFYKVLTGRLPKFNTKMNNKTECLKGIKWFYENNAKKFDEEKQRFIKDIISKMVQYDRDERAEIKKIKEEYEFNQFFQKSTQNLGDIYIQKYVQQSDISNGSQNKQYRLVNRIQVSSTSQSNQISEEQVVYQNQQVCEESQNTGQQSQVSSKSQQQEMANTLEMFKNFKCGPVKQSQNEQKKDEVSNQIVEEES